MARELPNARAALEWAEAPREAELGLQLAGFARLWHLRGELSEALRWQERMLALDSAVRAQGGPAAPLSLRVRRLYGFPRSLLAAGMLEHAEAIAQEALALAEDAGDAVHRQRLHDTGPDRPGTRDLDAAEVAFAVSAAHAESAGPGNLRLWALTNLAEVARARGDLSRAEELLAKALALRGPREQLGSRNDRHTDGPYCAPAPPIHTGAGVYRESLGFFSAFVAPRFSLGASKGWPPRLWLKARRPRCAALRCLASMRSAPPPPPHRRSARRSSRSSMTSAYTRRALPRRVGFGRNAASRADRGRSARLGCRAVG